jgi:hypothetical protein
MKDGRVIGALTAGVESSAGIRQEFEVILNWWDELRRLVPTK